MNIDKEINNLVNYTMKMGELVLDNLQLAMSTYYHYDKEEEKLKQMKKEYYYISKRSIRKNTRNC